jgi:HTH-type transcriptional regulator, sugar sensing transcriptional regulator
MKTSKKKSSLSALHIRQGTEEVLTALATLGRSPAADIAAHLNKPKSSIYDGLDELQRQGLVVEESNDRGRVFSLAETEHLKQLKTSKITDVEQAFAEVIKLSQNKSRSVSQPRIKFYSGVEGMRQAFRDMNWTSEYRDTYLMWPMQEMLDTLGEEFLRFHSSGRYKHRVVLHAISKESDRKLRGDPHHEWLQHDPKEKLREVRYAPKHVDWAMSFWSYGNQTLFAGGGSEKFAFIIRSKDFTELMIELWKSMWEKSKK